MEVKIANKSMWLKAYIWTYSLLSLVVFLILISLFYKYCITPRLLEVREYAEANAAICIRNGVYFSLEYFPGNLYLYGPLQPFISSLFIGKYIFINRFISVVSLLLIFIPVYVFCNKVQINKPYIYKIAISFFITTIIIVSSLHSLVFGRPDSIGLFIYCYGISITLTNPFKNYYLKYLVYIIILYMILLTKQYYGVILVFFLINERKDIIGMAILIFSLISFFILCYFFLPVYFLSWLHHINIAGKLPYTNSIQQFIILFKNLNIFVIVLLGLLCFHKLDRIKQNNVMCNRLLIFIFFIISLLFFSMGRHHGNWMTYFNELLVPCLAFLFILLIPYISPKIIITIMILCTATVAYPQIKAFSQRLRTSEKTFSYTIHDTDTIFACPAAFKNPDLRQKYMDKDAGQMEYLDRLYPSTNYLHTLQNIKIADKKIKIYEKNLIEKLNNQEYDLIIFNSYCILNRNPYKEYLTKNYTESKINKDTSIFTRKELSKAK